VILGKLFNVIELYTANQMHRKFLFQFIGLFLLLRFVFAISGQRRCVSNVCFNGGSCIVEERPGDEAAVFECICPTG
jgi:hypothetical protein